MKTADTVETEQRIIESFESSFRCMPGPAMAFFEIPQKDAPLVRAIYVVYAVTGQNLDDMERWFMERVVRPLKNIAGDDSYLYWRNPERVSVAVRTISSCGLQYVIRTRIAVLNKSLEEVRLSGDVIKSEGELPTELL